MKKKTTLPIGLILDPLLRRHLRTLEAPAFRPRKSRVHVIILDLIKTYTSLLLRQRARSTVKRANIPRALARGRFLSKSVSATCSQRKQSFLFFNSVLSFTIVFSVKTHIEQYIIHIYV